MDISTCVNVPVSFVREKQSSSSVSAMSLYAGKLVCAPVVPKVAVFVVLHLKDWCNGTREYGCDEWPRDA